MGAENLYVVKYKNGFFVASTEDGWRDRYFPESAQAHCYISGVMRDELIEAKAEVERLRVKIGDLVDDADEKCDGCQWFC